MKVAWTKLFAAFSALYLSLAAGQGFALSPVLPLGKAASDIPMLTEAVRDPDLAYEPIQDEGEAQRIAAQAKVDADALAKAEPAAKPNLFESLMKAHTRLSYFYEDVKAGRTEAASSRDLIGQITRNRGDGARYASELLKVRPDDPQAIYILGMNQILNGDGAGFTFLSGKRKLLGADRVHRAEFIAAMRSTKATPAVRKTLLSAMNSVGASAQVAGYMYIARNEKNPAPYLKNAVQVSTKLPKADRETVVSSALGVWVDRAGSKVNYAKLPFDLKPHADLAVTRAIRERAVLQSSGKNMTEALKFYRGIVESTKGTAQLAPVEERILEIEEMNANSSKSYAGYEKSLVLGLEMMNDGAAMGRGNENAVKESRTRIAQRYRRFVLGLVADAKNPKASKAVRSQAIAIASTYVANTAAPADKIPLRTEVGRIYALNGQHAEAVRTFMDLKKESQGQKAQEFLLMAMESQRVLAKWPAQAPWKGLPKENTAARQALADMYEERFQATQSWDDLAQHGLLLINVNNGGKAFQVWTKNLEKNPTGPHAQLAAGMMLASYRQSKSWQKLEDVARLSIKAKLNPTFGGHSLDPVALLGDALFEGGKEHFGQKRYAEASEKLSEFVKKYKKDPRRVEGMFVLGKAYHFNNKHPASVETMLALVTEYPRSPYEHDALLLGGDWSIPMAWEDQTIFFHQKFVDHFPTDAKVPALRMSLVELYLGRELYGNAVRAHAAQSEDNRVPKAERIDSAMQVMAIEERYGDAKYAVWGANKARELSGNDPVIVARTMSFDARRAAKSGDFNKIRSVEATLSKMNVRDRNVVESLAELRFLIAEKQATETKQEIFNLAQTDVRRTLATQYGIFQKTQAAYDRVCEVGPSTYCGLAMLRLSESTRNTLSSIENLSIPQTLDEKTVRSFENDKLNVINALGKSSARAESVALGISAKGETTPEWSQEITVTNSDNGIERSHGATGSGYVQWMPVKAEQ